MASIDHDYLGSLVEEMQHGNTEAFSEFYAATYKKQYGFAYNYMQDPYLAQDALQETYISAFKHIQVLKDPTLAVAWLNQINFRVCYQMKNKLVRQDSEELSDSIKDSNPSPEDIAVNVENSKYLVSQILNLPFTESQCILLKYYQNKSIKEIADMLDISKSSVKRYTSKALGRLRQILKD